MHVSSKILKSISVEAGLPNIIGNWSNTDAKGVYGGTLQGAVQAGSEMGTYYSYANGGSKHKHYEFQLNAHSCSTIYGNSATVTPLSQKTNFMIKY